MKGKVIVHNLSLLVFACIFGYAGLYKVTGHTGMMEGMAALGFGREATLLIGWAEVAGVLGLLAGWFLPGTRSAAVLWLLPFGIGAFAVHMAHHDGFADYKESLLVCILAPVVLLTDRYFRVSLR